MNGHPSPTRRRARGTWIALAAGLVAGPRSSPAGLTLRLEGGGGSEESPATNVWLRVAPAQSPSPFLPPGPFRATWSGGVVVDLRGDYRFQADVAGNFRLFLNETEVLATNLVAGTTEWSAPVRLRKGTNLLQAVLDRPANGEARVRLRWQGRGIPPGPIPTAALTEPTHAAHTPGSDGDRSRGRDAFLRLRCGRCHTVEGTGLVPEWEQDAPTFEGIGSRRSPAWLYRWIENPAALRPDASMPRVFSGPEAGAKLAAITAWLGSLTNAGPTATSGGQPAIGKALAQSLRCGSCHVLPGEATDATKLALTGVRAKFLPGTLADYLQRPSAHYTWTRMPDFRLTPDEAGHLAAWLEAAADPPATATAVPPPGPALVAQGRQFAESAGCLRCHTGPAKDQLHVPRLDQLPLEAWSRGCLSEDGPTPATLPRYAFAPLDRLDLRAFAATDRASLRRHVPADFAARWSRDLRCSGCHEGVEGIPSIAGAGGKLRPEWTADLLEGRIPGKTRTWLPARMPAFPAVARRLAEGLAAQHGLPGESPGEPAIDAPAAEDGRKLVSASGGFACVTCHAIGSFGATAVFEAPGINLALVGGRLLPEYFARWVRNPQLIEPTTKMPLYFDEEGNSALADFYGGDGARTIHALWQYVRQGPSMAPPAP